MNPTHPALGIDYGEAKIGVALATGPLAEPLCTISTIQSFSILPKIISDQSVKTVIVGLPEGNLNKKVLDFINKLEIYFNSRIPQIIPYDETLSTHDAKIALLHTSAKHRQKSEHAVAATIILQSWLDSLA